MGCGGREWGRWRGNVKPAMVSPRWPIERSETHESSDGVRPDYVDLGRCAKERQLATPTGFHPLAQGREAHPG